MNHNDVYDELEEMPQFIDSKRGILNVLTGCEVEWHDDYLILSWGKKVSGPMITGGGSNHKLDSKESLEKFLAVMRIQAKQYSSFGT